MDVNTVIGQCKIFAIVSTIIDYNLTEWDWKQITCYPFNHVQIGVNCPCCGVVFECIHT